MLTSQSTTLENIYCDMRGFAVKYSDMYVDFCLGVRKDFDGLSVKSAKALRMVGKDYGIVGETGKLLPVKKR